ncbi:MAG TPA: dihydrodipicolinate reductase C-terminal domain-containing protein [Thermomicrobiales bacterium]|nr:dihydrodipicolinate reductase C-terminal domain-containing protein [Thermomicrobiales bacterium]
MTNTIRIGIAGILGRMGDAVATQVEADPGSTLGGGLVRPGSQKPPGCPWRLETDPGALLADIDVLIDVSLPEATASIAHACAGHATPLVCGVTGLDVPAMDALRAASERIPVWYARNLSHGVGVLLRLLPTLAAELKGYDVSIVERHHRHKRDAPSGTALALGRATGGEPAIASVRAGGITGEHEIAFTNDVEEITVGHRALSRAAFAAGAVRAAHTVHGAQPGWYSPEPS